MIHSSVKLAVDIPLPEPMIALITLGLTLWGLYCIVGIVQPVRPFSGRAGAAKSLGQTALLFVGTAWVLGSSVQSTPQQTAEQELPSAPRAEQSAVQASVQTGGEIPAPCGEGGLELSDVVAVSGDHDLRAEPNASASLIRNEKASQALGVDHYHQIDNSTTVRRLCVQSDWTEVQIVTPDWLTHVKGWVPNTALREIERSDDGGRVYVEDDFYWDEDTSEYKPQIVAIVNRIASENRNCSEIDPSSVAESPSRSTPNNPVFFVTCGSGADVFNVWFSPADAASEQVFAATEPLAKSAAVDACEAESRRAAVHPSTVEFSRIWDLAYMPHASGRARVVSTFTAKNSLNLELTYRIDCLFEGPNLIETQIAGSLQ